VFFCRTRALYAPRRHHFVNIAAIALLRGSGVRVRIRATVRVRVRVRVRVSVRVRVRVSVRVGVSVRIWVHTGVLAKSDKLHSLSFMSGRERFNFSSSKPWWLGLRLGLGSPKSEIVVCAHAMCLKVR
jgi:hypothetical protein